MANDELAEINGIKPNRVIADGEEVEAASKTSKAVYKVKRTFDHYYCTCPAWRNQSKMPTNARSCKHLREILGDAYEDARLKLKNPDGETSGKAPKSGGSKKASTVKKPPSAAKKAPARGKRRRDEEDEEEEEEEEPEERKPAKRARTTAGRGKVAAKEEKAKDEKEEEETVKEEGKDDEAMDVDEDPDAKPSRQPTQTVPNGDDELAEINGVKPKQVIPEGEEVEYKSRSSRATYKVKRTFDHYYCTCPAWRNQSKMPVNARTCKHLRELLGDEYEDARLKLKNPDGVSTAPASKKPVPRARSASRGKPTSRSKPASKGKAPASRASRRGKEPPVKEEEEEVDEDEDGVKKEGVEVQEEEKEEETFEPAAKPSSKGTEVPKAEPEAKAEDPDMEVDEDEGESDESAQASSGPAGNEDELAEINGIKPMVYMKDGEERDAKSMTSSSVYKVKRTWDHYYCTCPAWRNQGGMPTNARSCKHLRQLLGDAYEDARLHLKNPDGNTLGRGAKKAATRSKGKSKAADADDEDDDGDAKPKSKKSAAPALLLANKWDLEDGPDPTGWWISEKLDGVRTYYDGEQMISRLGNPFTPPSWFLDKLPKDMTLDGELFGGRREFQSTVSIVKTVNSPHWQNITFQIFDIPSRGDEPFEDRVAFLKKTFGKGGTHAQDQIEVVDHEEVKDRDHVLAKLKEVESLGGEGVMLRKPQSTYVGSRSNTLLKVKTFYDAEARVTGYVPGKGQHKGVTGALKCEMASGKKFNVGSGLSHKQRQNPPKVDTIIVYRFQELTRDGVPRFPTFLGEAADKMEPKDAEVPEHRKVTATGGE